MCIKLGSNELGSVKGLMTISLNAIIADVFELDLDEISPQLNLRNDLGMDEEKQSELVDMVDEYFDGLTLDFSSLHTLRDLFDVVVEQEFKDIPAEAFSY